VARVLIVEDDPMLGELLREALRDEDHCVALAARAEAAQPFIARRWPDVLLLDVHLPGMDGWTFLRACRADAWASHLGVILLAPRSERRDDDPAGVVYLPKPFSLEGLLEAVATFTRRISDTCVLTGTGSGLS
jgi:DNA-binding response OmpR family regulator